MFSSHFFFNNPEEWNFLDFHSNEQHDDPETIRQLSRQYDELIINSTERRYPISIIGNHSSSTVSSSSEDRNEQEPVRRFKLGLNKRVLSPSYYETHIYYPISVSLSNPQTINPRRLGFIPSKNDFWPNETYTLHQLIVDYFRKRNHPDARFCHKLYNALILSTDTDFSYVIGVRWVSSHIIHVESLKFALFLGVKNPKQSFFHHQGNFPSCGFVELTPKEVEEQLFI